MLFKSRRKTWYRNLSRNSKKWLRFARYAKRKSRSRLVIWAPFFQKDDSLRPLYLFRELTLSPKVWSKKSELEENFTYSSFLP